MCLIPGIQIGHQFLDRVKPSALATTGFEHSLNCCLVRDERLKGKPTFGYDTHHHQPEGVGYGKPDRFQDDFSFLFDAGIDARPDDLAARHGSDLFQATL